MFVLRHGNDHVDATETGLECHVKEHEYSRWGLMELINSWIL